jgi:3'(2'), 5'-bisphosphate nucleotidase
MRYVAIVLGGGDLQLRIPGGPKPSHMYVWDHAGLHLILTEAGCTVTDLNGQTIDFGAGRDLALNFGVIAAKRGVHGRMLQVVKEVLNKTT